jgi:hypothetical protein
MTDQAICYIALRRGAKPRSLDMLKKSSGFQKQKLQQVFYARHHDLKIIGTVHDHSTSATADVTKMAGFRQALTQAREDGAILLIPDLMILLCRLEKEKALERFHAIKNEGVEIVDLTIGKRLFAISDNAFKAVYQAGKHHKQINSAVAKRSALMRKVKTSAGIARKASKVASAEAEHFHKRIKPHVSDAISQVRLSGKVTLEKIADELNRQGVRTLQGRDWSKGTVRNILSKLDMDWKA